MTFLCEPGVVVYAVVVYVAAVYALVFYVVVVCLTSGLCISLCISSLRSGRLRTSS